MQVPEQGQGRPELPPDRGGVVTLPGRPEAHHEDPDDHQRRGEDPASSVPRDFRHRAMHPAGRVSRRSILAAPQPVVKVMIGVIGHTASVLPAMPVAVYRMAATVALYARPEIVRGKQCAGARLAGGATEQLPGKAAGSLAPACGPPPSFMVAKRRSRCLAAYGSTVGWPSAR